MEPIDRPAHPELAALTLFAAALDIEEPSREAWLVEQCGRDSALLERVNELLVADAACLLTGDASDLATQAPVVPPRQVGSYRLDELIGAGGMGSVYRASRNDGLFDRTVAIKFIRPLPGLTESLVDAERRLLARMEHAGIARILDGGLTENGLHFLVMEFVSGVALDQYTATASLDIRSRVKLMREICAGVAHAHQHLVVHCDIKPANILVTQEGWPKLIDFGVARIQDVADARPEGFTRAYTSPQRLSGAPATVADDVYSLGVVLRELLTSRVEPTEEELVALPEELGAVVRKATASEPQARHASVTSLDDDLRCWLECRPVSAVGDDWRYRARKLMQRHPWRVAAASIAVVGLVSALAVIATLYAHANVARLEAERRFAEVRALANYMLFDLDSRLETTPGTTQARREMVGRSQQYLDTLAQTAGDNTELQREVAVGLARLGEVQGVPGKAHVGEPAASKANLERAERMMVALAEQQPQRADWQRDLGRVRYLLALVYGGQDNNGRRQLQKAQQAETHLQTALAAVGTSWTPSTAALADLNVLLTSVRLTQADSYKSQEKYAEAAAVQEGEERRLLALPEGVRQAMDFDYQSGRPSVMLGDSLFYLDRRDEALAAYRRGTQRFEAGLARNPRHRKLMEGVLIGTYSIASTLDEMERYPEALAALDRGLEIGARLVELDPANAEAPRMSDMVRGQRAITLAHLSRYDEAIRMIERGLQDKQERAAQTPDDAERARDLAVPLRNLARLYRDKGDLAGSCRVLKQAVETWTALDRRFGLSEFDVRNELSVVREQLARCPASRRS